MQVYVRVCERVAAHICVRGWSDSDIHVHVVRVQVRETEGGQPDG